MSSTVYGENPNLTKWKQGELFVEVNTLGFFRNNEYAGSVVNGYSLPGFWAQPKVGYYLLDNVKLELGAHLLRYWGTNTYPCFAYSDISQWKGGEDQKGFHLLPWFRGHVKLSDRFQLVLGNIYGGVNHRLIEPLYNPELSMTADPEVGLQMLYNSPAFSLDAWMNWESFIFKNDVHQEAFSVGLSTRVNLNKPDSKYHFYIPAQAIVQHRGGEIDTLFTESVQTIMNSALGVGMDWHVGNRFLKKIEVEVDAAAYYQQTGNLWVLGKGWGLGARVAFDIARFRFKGGYWRSDDFISLFGIPYYGSVSLSDKTLVFNAPQLMTLGAEYTHSLSESVSLGADFDLFQHFHDGQSSTSFTFGVYLRLSPSFVLARFRK